MDTRTADGVPGLRAPGPGGSEAGRACHDVLLAVAGRVPDRSLWRLRDWLACDAGVALRTALPRTLVRHRVGVTDAERTLLRSAVLGWAGSPRLVDAVLHLDEAPDPEVAFDAEGPHPGWDAVDLALRALAPAPGVRDLRRAWRRDTRGAGPAEAPPARVVLVGLDDDGPDPIVLTGALQRGLRALGEPEPRVEVLAPGSAPTPYHVAARAGSELLWAAGEGPGGPLARAVPATGELVPHG